MKSRESKNAENANATAAFLKKTSMKSRESKNAENAAPYGVAAGLHCPSDPRALKRLHGFT
jgi:hypothetical protein